MPPTADLAGLRSGHRFSGGDEYAQRRACSVTMGGADLCFFKRECGGDAMRCASRGPTAERGEGVSLGEGAPLGADARTVGVYHLPLTGIAAMRGFQWWRGKAVGETVLPDSGTHPDSAQGLAADDAWSADPPAGELSDTTLCEIVRSGTNTARGKAAFAELFGRHRAAAMAQAYRMVQDRERAEECVQEAFARVLRAFSRGKGPTESVLGYVLVTLRTVVIRSSRIDGQSIPVAPGQLAELLEDLAPRAGALSEADRMTSAFLELQPEARETLWLLEVEQVPIATLAEQLGITEGTLRVQAHRARKRLATRYLSQHVETSGPACSPVLPMLADYVRNELGKRDARTVTAHLGGCPHCTKQVRLLGELSSKLRTVVGPALVGGSVVTGAGAAAFQTVPAQAAMIPADGATATAASTWVRAGAWALLIGAAVAILLGAFNLLSKTGGEITTVPPSPIVQGSEASAAAQPSSSTEGEAEDRGEPSSDAPPAPNPSPEDDSTPFWILRN